MLQKLFLLVSGFACLAILFPILAQDTKGNRSQIELAIEAKDYQKAGHIVQNDVQMFIAAGNMDTLVAYIPFIGAIAQEQQGTKAASAAVFAHIQLLKDKRATPALLVDAYQAAAEYFAVAGQNKDGFTASEEALRYTLANPAHTDQDIAKCEYNLGIYAHRLGDVSLSLTHHRHAMVIRDSDKKTDPEDIYLSANAMGSLMWYASKYDSASIMFKRSLDALAKMPQNDLNKYFRPGNVQNNLAALYSAEGRTTEAIDAMNSTISNFQNFIASKEPHPKKQSATEGLFEAIDNLAGIYKEIGDYGKAGNLLRYSYTQKKQKLGAEHPGIFISEILLGQHYNSLREYDTASYYLDLGLSKLDESNGEYLFWAADAYYTKALIHENKKEMTEAEQMYIKSEKLYEESYQGQYDNVYMDFLRSASLFYAKNGNFAGANERANKINQYLITVGEGNSLQAFYQQLNIAEINYLAKRYPEAIQQCDRALKTVNVKMQEGKTLLDSVKMDVFRPKAILIRAKSEYQLKDKKDTTFLQSLSVKLDEALNVLDKRKVLIDDDASINILISENRDLIDFAKTIQLRLAELTGHSIHLDKLINLQESALYNRIRSRMTMQKALRFSQVPQQVLDEEQALKKAITASLRENKPTTELMKEYAEANNHWDDFLQKLKKDHPAYYAMRYATIFKSIPELQSSLPDSTTVIRYFFTDSALAALVIDKQSKKVVQLSSQGLEKKINDVLSTNTAESARLPYLFEIYKSIWQPVTPYLRNKRITIIPDGILYNLSFEMLPVQQVSSYQDLASHCLLAKHLFSYHYSLFMLNQSVEGKYQNENYIAFVPGFSDEMKSKYISVAKDSVNLDYSYLHLLPQPATNKLAKKVKDMIGGDIYLDEQSTRHTFKTNAGGHKVIHIGTHAEYNNIHPEKSGLLFAKNDNSASDSNFVSLFDIYNCNMQSDLTVLTACESGRPGYQDGEGMVSLAHAFNYAGSQRILTALWKIDEQSSSKITEFFFENLKNGLFTDEALQMAKLQYLKTTEGRMLAPSYWAGLVLMGEPSVLPLEQKKSFWIWTVAGLIIVGSVFFFVFRKKIKETKRMAA